MPLQLNHTIVPSLDKQVAARFCADIFGGTLLGDVGPFAAVAVTPELTFDFDEGEPFEPHHYGFLVDDATFDAILARIKASDAPFGAGLEAGWNREINQLNGGRGVYVQDPSGHVYEAFTRVPEA